MNSDNNLSLRMGKKNLWFIGAGMIVIIIGFALMMGPVSEEGAFEADIFSFRRTVVAPVIVFLGYLSVILSILFRPKNNAQQ